MGGEKGGEMGGEKGGEKEIRRGEVILGRCGERGKG